ncbi:hypothetical protein SOVF_090370 [Spinacia oleracea]|nr:hypothetical protein SOVF_090370 [Spinacia oleracea]
MPHESDDARVKASEVESVVGRIVDLTKELVFSTKEGSLYTTSDFEKFPSQFLGKHVEDYRSQKIQLEAELELTKENLKAKEMELLASQRKLAIQDEELEMVLERLEEKDRELKELEERRRDEDDLNKLSILANESVDDLSIEKLQLEAAQLEVEAATSALHKLAEMRRELLNKASLSIDSDLEVNVFLFCLF